MSEATVPARGRRRGPSKGDLREAAIVDTLVKLLTERPFSSVTVDELAQGAGISRSAFYFYFDSREAVLAALSTRISTLVFEASASWLRRGDEPESPHELLRRATLAYLQLWDDHGPVLRAIANSCAGDPDPDVQAFWSKAGERFVTVAAEQIERERDDGRALPGPPSSTELALVLCAMTERACHAASQRALDAEARAHLADTLATVWARAIYGT